MLEKSEIWTKSYVPKPVPFPLLTLKQVWHYKY